MKGSFFSTQARIDQLNRAAEGWLGTPFHPNAMVKGRGVSCQMLVAAVLIECGHLKVDHVPAGPMNWHGATSIIEQQLDVEHADQFQSIFGEPTGEGLSHPPPPLVGLPVLSPGDVVGFRLHGTVHHCGLAVTPELFIHVLRHSAVCVMPINDAVWLSRLKRVWRPVES